MARLYEIGFETPEDYKEIALENGRHMLENVAKSPRYLAEVRRMGIYDDLQTAAMEEHPDMAALGAKIKSKTSQIVDDETLFELLLEKYPDAEFSAKDLAALREEIKKAGLAKEADLPAIENEVTAAYALDNFVNASDICKDPHLTGLDAIAEAVANNPKLKENLELLVGHHEEVFNGNNGSEPFAYKLNEPRPGANRAAFSYDAAHESLSLKVMDLNGTGLNFALNTNKASEKPQSLVLTNDNSEMSEEQIRELARFFYKGGLIKDSDTLNLPSDIKVMGDSNKSFREVFNEAFEAERTAQQHTETQERAELSSQNEEQPVSAAQESVRSNHVNNGHMENGHVDDGYDRYLNDAPSLKPSYGKMRDAMENRAGLMGFRREYLHWRRNLDGSMTMICYLNEADEVTDNELDKKGIQARKKSFAMKVHAGPPPAAWLYIEPGKEIKSGHAKMALKAFQTQGCRYFIPPKTTEIGGAGGSAIWKAAGSMGICPKLKCSDKDDGFVGFSNDNLQEMLKTPKEEDKLNPKDILLWKMRLVREVKNYVAYRESKGNDESKLSSAIASVEGDIKFSRFNASYKGVIDNYIREQCSPDNPNRWTEADMASAVMASQELLRVIATGKDKKGQSFDYNYINENPERLIDFMVVKMAENRPTIDKMIDERYEVEKRTPKDPEDETTQGGSLKRAAQAILKESKENMQSYVDGLVGDYGESAKIEMKLPAGAALTEATRYRATPQSGQSINGQDRRQLYNQHRRVPLSVERGGRN